MTYKKNFRFLITGHLILLVLLVVLILVMGADNKHILMGLLAGLVVSMALQLVLYLVRPQLFNSKVSQHPHMP